MRQRICDVCEAVTTPGTLIQLRGIFRVAHPMGGLSGRHTRIDLCSAECLTIASEWLKAASGDAILPRAVQ